MTSFIRIFLVIGFVCELFVLWNLCLFLGVTHFCCSLLHLYLYDHTVLEGIINMMMFVKLNQILLQISPSKCMIRNLLSFLTLKASTCYDWKLLILCYFSSPSSKDSSQYVWKVDSFWHDEWDYPYAQCFP